MTSNNFEVTPSGGAGRWGFRACVYQTGNIYATTHTATARTKDFAPKEIFLTARAYKGNLGGVAGADTICQHRATVSLGEPAVNPWKAVLSSSVLSAASHIGLGAAALNSISSDAVAAANTFFGGGSISGQPQYDDLGRMTAGVKVWTGSGTTGANSGDNCNDWASSTNTFDGSVGDPDFTTSGLWLDNGTLESCDYSHRLYCIRSP
jgi:hypothetical protein